MPADIWEGLTPSEHNSSPDPLFHAAGYSMVETIWDHSSMKSTLGSMAISAGRAAKGPTHFPFSSADPVISPNAARM